ncbi:putative ribosomal protein S11, mitochondrial [Capsicum chinense]|nr:putative ribosomal protein S11, mitochondrial [Capsicum chinense]
MGNNSRPMDIIRELTEDSKRVFPSGVPLARYHIEQDADIVHMKVLRNNAFVTVTDSKGNRKFGATAGKLTGKGTKIARYAAESTAEHVGREARDRGLKSVVMKVNGFTYFKKKKQAILSFREGYTHSRGDKNPVVYIEDTTRRPHNGCRLPKKRRI